MKSMNYVVVAVLAACGGAKAPAPQSTTEVPAPPVEVAAPLKVPDGQQLVGSYAASGVQIYECADGAWKLLEPAATLASKDGKTMALHSRGPVWVSTADGSAVNAAPVDGAKNARPNAVPELLLKATTARGDGLFAKVSYVQRLQTAGGVAPASACTAGATTAVPYSAIYNFFAPQ